MLSTTGNGSAFTRIVTLVLTGALSLTVTETATAQLGRCAFSGPLASASDALHALLTADGASSCAHATCDADGDGNVSLSDAAAILNASIGLAATLACPSAEEEASCGHLVSRSGSWHEEDVHALIERLTAEGSCPNYLCDVDGSGLVDGADAARLAALASGDSVTASCPPDARQFGRQNCFGTVQIEQCKIKSRARSARGARMVCKFENQGSRALPIGSVESLIELEDSTGTCFSTLVYRGACSHTRSGVRCKNPSDELVSLRYRIRRDNQTKMVAKTAAPLSCAVAPNSPWGFRLSLGENCVETGCPSPGNRTECPGTCGNGVVDPGEQCDDGPAGSFFCLPTCLTVHPGPVCGDGVVNQVDEECDEAQPTATCNSDCTLAICGDGLLNFAAGEDCDDGNTVAGDGCSDLCAEERCGNRVVDAGETCDDGLFGSTTCDGDCTSVECGDGLRNSRAGESCDDGNTVSGDGCSGICQGEFCGNSVIDVGEICDEGSSSPICDRDCTPTACGDGLANAAAGEECDDGNTTPLDGCDDTCLLEGCGNLRVDPGEECDESFFSGNCDFDCTFAVCGDALRNIYAGERCDDGNTLSGDGCSDTCQHEFCGNGVIEPGEICDEGSFSATCDRDCTPVACGDGLLNTRAGEECDDGNLTSNDGCSDNCLEEGCGNGRLDPGEQCDAGRDTATCDIDCTGALCGDGYRNFSAGERCDDGNLIAGDGCSPECQNEVCGNEIVDPGEECDEDTFGGSAFCDDDCTFPVCGDGILNVPSGEQCDSGLLPRFIDCRDLGFGGGTLGCDDLACSFDFATCALFEQVCSVTISVVTENSFSDLRGNLDYSSIPGEFAGEGSSVVCDRLWPTSSSTSIRDSGGLGLLTLRGFFFQSFVTPADIAICEFGVFSPTATVAPEDFIATAFAYSQADGDAEVEIAVTDVNCSPALPRLPTAHSTGRQSSSDYDVFVALSDPVDLSALRYRIGYGGASGEFSGSGSTQDHGGTLECEDLSGADMSVLNDTETTFTLSHAFASTSPVSGPLDLVRCTFRSSSANPPTADDFAIAVAEAVDGSGSPRDVSVEINRIVAK